MTVCPACTRASELGMQPALCGDHINAWRVEEACRRWWEVERDGKRVATMSWDDAVQKFSTENPAAIADYRLRAAAVLGVKL